MNIYQYIDFLKRKQTEIDDKLRVDLDENNAYAEFSDEGVFVSEKFLTYSDIQKIWTRYINLNKEATEAE